MKYIYKAVSREGLGLFIVASLCTTARAETINDASRVADLPSDPKALYIGDGGTGSLTIKQNESVVSGQDPAFDTGSVLGYGRGDKGTLTIDGGTWYDSVTTSNDPSGRGTTAVGGGGDGTLDIKNGGEAYAMFINIGQNNGSNGVVNVDGADSHLFVNADQSSGITVGTNGTGALNISNAGKVTSTSTSYVGDSHGASGTVNVSGDGSNWTITDGPLHVGRHGSGVMNITSGGTVNSAGGGIAAEDGSVGHALVSGTGSTWDIGSNRTLTIGYTSKDSSIASSTGTLTVADGGRVVAEKAINVAGDASTIYIGTKDGEPAAAPGTLETAKVNLLNDTTALVFNHSDTSGNYLFSPIVTGQGSVTNLNGTTVLTGANIYTGGTTISGGTLQLGDGSTVGSLVGDITNNSAFVINNPAETTLGGVISGTGTLTQQGAGTTALQSANRYTGETVVNAGTLRTDIVDSIASSKAVNINGGVFDLNGNNQWVNRLGGTGGEVQLNGATLTANNATTADDSSYAGDIIDGTAKGSLTKAGDGSLTLTGKTAWTGDTHIDGGELVLDGTNGGAQLVSNIIGKDNTTLSLQNGANLTGWIDPTDVNIDKTSSWDMTADSMAGDVNLAGTIRYAAPSTLPMTSGHTLTVNNWNGQDGTLQMNTVLGDDASVTDKLVVNGNTSGNTFMQINNAGGGGASTVEGIRVVEVNGQSDGTFAKSGRIVAGAYDYSLVKKGSDWFLTSLDTTEPPKPDIIVPPEPPVDPVDPEDPETPPTPEPNPEPDNQGKPTVRPESASYTANLAAANTMFITRLHDRLGETQYTDALTGEKKVTSLWLRQVGGHNRWKDSSGQISTQSNRYVVQLGGDLAQWSNDGLQRWHLGAMAGYGNNRSNSHSNITGYHSEGSVDGYSAGLYATWYENDETHQGTYLDSWAQYGWFNNHVKGQNIQGESYKSSGVTASLELGYTHKLGEFIGSQGSTNEWFIQPQAQAIWMGVKADDHRESNGTRVSGEGDGNIQTRLGVRTYLKGHSKIDDGKNRIFQPFVEANWIHNTNDFGTRMDGASVYQSGARNIGEIKTGVEGQLNPHLNLWGNVGVQVGDKGYSDSSAMVGVKYSF
ncbi:autotransporter outer membrane beta-barrel domain-containing protein [Buttiauxella selenatireducens]|uniref:Autotransporter outer membrane beta-barrel domain-containing protein n=1 Tax=Buttiauxella selenatireducens TaxID=3073902 RepID=A0ABY9S8P6_9ENTR|nr:autotransporter outer membrane beta-barrel domain-containing protein [Buttiauxella sp. R73]WMY73893.1 autotransporter outer membrane beta-barrel domain-containing protein [Buttiauxella sp. R73]